MGAATGRRHELSESRAGRKLWLAFLLYYVLTKFAELARMREDIHLRRTCVPGAATAAQYRATCLDGTGIAALVRQRRALGSSTNQECQNRFPAAKLVVISVPVYPASRQRVNAVDRRLVHRDSGYPYSPLLRQKLRSIRSTSKVYIPVCARTAANIPTGDLGRMPLRSWRSRAAWSYLLCSTRSIMQHTRTNRHYKVEPYVIAADVYAVAPHTGRGGWTWYTDRPLDVPLLI